MMLLAAELLLALIDASAAANNLRQPLHGPYQLPPNPYKRRANLDSPIYPTGTVSATTSWGHTAHAGGRPSITATALESSHAFSMQQGQGRSTPSLSSDRSGNLAQPTWSPFTPSPNLSSDFSATLSTPSRTQSRNTNSSGEAAPSGHVRHPPSPSSSTVSSEDGSVSVHTHLTNSSALHTAHGSLANQTKPSFNPPRPPACTGATLHIKNASLDYWYAETYTQVDSTFLIQLNENETSTGWTLLPATSSLDIVSAIGNPACSSTSSFNSDLGQSGLEYSCSQTSTPAAKATTVVEQTAYKQPNATFSDGDIPDVVVAPTPAALTVVNADATSTYHAGTSVVHFSQYEIVSTQPYHHWNGSVDCVETTETYDLPRPASFEYDGETAVNESLAVGKLGTRNFALLQALEMSDVVLPHSVALGKLVAEPTVVVVVEKVVVAAAGFAQGILAPAPSLDTPLATLPPGLSFERTTPTETGTIWVPFTAHVESSADSLEVPSKTTQRPPLPHRTENGDISNVGGQSATGVKVVPFVAHVENSRLTLAIAMDATKSQDVVTAQFSGKVVKATSVSGPSPSFGGNADAERVATVIESVAQPSDALQVLNNAQAEFSTNAVASAIAVGLGITAPSDDGVEHPPGPRQSLATSNFNSGNPNPELILGTSVFTATRVESGLLLEGQTAAAGGPPITVASHVLSLSPDASAVAIGGYVIKVGGAMDSAHVGVGEVIPSLTIGTSVVAATRVADGFIVDGKTLSAGKAPITIGGSEVSLSSEGSSIAIGGFGVNIGVQGNVGAAANIPVIQLGTRRFTANAATQYDLDGSVLAPGRQVVFAGTTVSLGPSATKLIVNGKSQLLSPPAITPAPLLTIGDYVYKPNVGSTYAIGSSLLVPGGQVVVSGTTISLPTSGQSIIINGIARSIARGRSLERQFMTITAPPVLVLDGMAVAPNAGTSYIISNQTLTPGGIVTFDKPSGPETVSLNAAAFRLVKIAGGHTFTSYVGMVGAAPGGAPVLTVEGHRYSAVEYDVGSGATYSVEGQSLRPGSEITIEGSNGKATISLVPAGTAIVINVNGIKSTSIIDNAYGVGPTNAPILTIGNELFTAINIGATYLVDGQTLRPGTIKTVTINHHRYIVSLSPQATIMEVVAVDANGEATSTMFQTLFPSTAATLTSTVSTSEVVVTEGASASSPSPTGTLQDGNESGALGSFSVAFAGAAMALGTLTLVLWL